MDRKRDTEVALQVHQEEAEQGEVAQGVERPEPLA